MDDVDLRASSPVIQHLMTSSPSEVRTPGQVVVHFKGENSSEKDFIIRYDARAFEASVEQVPLVAREDEGIRTKWGDTIYSINFKSIAPKTSSTSRGWAWIPAAAGVRR